MVRAQDADVSVGVVAARLGEVGSGASWIFSDADTPGGLRVSFTLNRPARVDSLGHFSHRLGVRGDVTVADYGTSVIVGPNLLLFDGRFRPYARASGGVGGLFRDLTWKLVTGGGLRVDLAMQPDPEIEMTLALYVGMDYVWHGRTGYLAGLAGARTAFATLEAGLSVGIPARGLEGRCYLCWF